MNRPHLHSGGRCPVLRALAILYMLGSVLAVAAGIYAVYWGMTRFRDGIDQIVLVAAACAATFIVVLTMLAAAELLKLFIDLEHNTRVSALRAIQEMTGGNSPLSGNGGRLGSDLDEETAEAALLRGH
jgi:hypothetical protein